MADLNALKTANAKRWANVKLTRNFSSIAKHLVEAKQRYITVQEKTGVPWFIIAVIHEREASQVWGTQLGQGDPLHSVSVHVPKDRGPFPTWEAGAVDALAMCKPYAARNKDWSAGGALTLLETYNGLAYANQGIPSPYVWSGTNQYTRGKIVRDHGPIEPIIDQQLGCAGLLVAMMAIDPTITFTGAVLTPNQPTPEPAGVWNSVFSLFKGNKP